MQWVRFLSFRKKNGSSFFLCGLFSIRALIIDVLTKAWETAYFLDEFLFVFANNWIFVCCFHFYSKHFPFNFTQKKNTHVVSLFFLLFFEAWIWVGLRSRPRRRRRGGSLIEAEVVSKHRRRYVHTYALYPFFCLKLIACEVREQQLPLQANVCPTFPPKTQLIFNSGQLFLRHCTRAAENSGFEQKYSPCML